MKYCPICNTRYDEEILRFCMKDGTPLVDEEEPAFIEMPSESVEEPVDDDPAEVTVIRNHSPQAQPQQNAIDEISFSPDVRTSGERIVVPTSELPPPVQPRARVIPPYMPLPQPPNTTKVVGLTIFGTIAAMALGALFFWFLQNDRTDNLNANINTNFNAYLENTNVNTNLGIDSNFNFNTNGNFTSPTNINTNFNTNVRTPTPTPSPRLSPSPTATPAPDDEDTPPPTPAPTRQPGTSPTPIVIRPGRTPEVPRMNPMPSNRPTSNRLEG